MFRDLAKTDLFSKPDPLVVCYEKKGENWEEIGRTETLKCAFYTYEQKFDTTGM